MRSKPFNYYLLLLFFFEIRKSRGDLVCLLLDNFNDHGNALLDLSGADYSFLPVEMTSVHQTLDQGILVAININTYKDFLFLPSKIRRIWTVYVSLVANRKMVAEDLDVPTMPNFLFPYMFWIKVYLNFIRYRLQIVESCRRFFSS